jgi:methionyl-tRNA synthetase
VMPNSQPADDAIQAVMLEAVANADAAMHAFAPHEALAQIWRIVESVNGYITAQEPWVLAKDEALAQRLDAVLYTSLDALRALAVVLSPFMPQATSKLWQALGANDSLGGITAQRVTDAGVFGLLPPGSGTGELTALFPRIEQGA